MLSRFFQYCLWLKCTTACVFLKSHLKDIRQKLVSALHNYEMLIFYSEEDSTKNLLKDLQLWFSLEKKNYVIWISPSRLERGMIKSINKPPLVFLNVSLAGFPSLLSTMLHLFYCCWARITKNKRMKLILWQEEMHIWVMKLTKSAFNIEKKIISPLHLFSSDSLWHLLSLMFWFQAMFFFAWMRMTFMWHLH